MSLIQKRQDYLNYQKSYYQRKRELEGKSYTSRKDKPIKLLSKSYTREEFAQKFPNFKEDPTRPIFRYFYDAENYLIKIDLTKPPQVLRNMGYKNIPLKKMMAGGNFAAKGYQFFKDIPDDKPMKVFIDNIRLTFNDTDGIHHRNLPSFTYNGTNGNLNEKLDGMAFKYCEEFYEYLKPFDDGKLWYIDCDVTSAEGGEKLNFVDGKVREELYPSLYSLITNVENSPYTHENCAIRAINAIKKRYGKISPKAIDKLLEGDGVMIKKIEKFCATYRIPLIFYDANLNCVLEKIPEIPSKSYKGLYGVVANGHLYLLNSKFLQKRSKDTLANEIILLETPEMENKLIECLNSGIVPHITNYRGKLYSFYIATGDLFGRGDNRDTIIKYINNSYYTDALNLLKTLGMEEALKRECKHDNVGPTNIIQKFILKCSRSLTLDPDGDGVNALPSAKTESFFPCPNRFTKSGFMWKSPSGAREHLRTIDKNKCYSYVTKNLPFLITTDYRSAKITEYVEGTGIVPHYLYLVKPEKPCLLFPDTNIYSGQHLIDCLDKCKFTILQEMECFRTENTFKDIVDLVYENSSPEFAKECLNCFIGTMGVPENSYENFAVNIISKEDAQYLDGIKKHIGNTNFMFNYQLKEKSFKNLTNRKPIEVQIKDAARLLLYRKIVEIGLKDEDIFAINTDSITFSGDYDCGILDADDFDGWKESNNPPEFKDSPYFPPEEEISLIIPNKFSNELHLGYAGCGKTHAVLTLTNELSSYIILVFTHVGLIDYKINNRNCNVFQYYQNNDKIPVENTIIIDEIGLCDAVAWTFIYKLSLVGKKIIAYGDFNQMLPVNTGKPMNSKHWIDFMFKIQTFNRDNYRNNFSNAFYDSLFSMDVDNLWKLLQEYSSPWEEAECIICYRNEIVDLYNEKKMQYLDIADMIDIGCSVICKTNNLEGIYNNFTGIVTGRKYYGEEIPDYQLLSPDENKDFYGIVISPYGYNIRYADFVKYFKPAYAKTIYGVQGTQLKSYHFAKEDEWIKHKPWFKNAVYTIISRLRWTN